MIQLTDVLGTCHPIATAPIKKNLLVWHSEYGAVTAHISEYGVVTEHVLVSDICGVHMQHVPLLFQKHLKPAPTHWMPLLEAPNAKLTG
jgi:hypothetical protein